MTGLSGAGKTTIARQVKELLEKEGIPIVIVDGDEYRKTLCKDLGFSKEDRQENIRRLGKAAFDFVKQGQVAIIAAINPYEVVRKELKDNYNAKTVWVQCPLDELIKRDTKGLYKKALLPDDNPEKVKNLTGVNDVFETPVSADIVLYTNEETAEDSAGRLYRFILSALGRQ